MEEKSIQAIYYPSRLDSQQAFCLPEPLVRLHDISHRECLKRIRVKRAFC
jgi:hypothetical protein